MKLEKRVIFNVFEYYAFDMIDIDKEMDNTGEEKTFIKFGFHFLNFEIGGGLARSFFSVWRDFDKKIHFELGFAQWR